MSIMETNEECHKARGIFGEELPDCGIWTWQTAETDDRPPCQFLSNPDDKPGWYSQIEYDNGTASENFGTYSTRQEALDAAQQEVYQTYLDSLMA